MKAFFYSILLCAVLAVGLAGWSLTVLMRPGPLEEPVTILFPSGDRFLQMTDALSRQKVIAHPLVFEIFAFARGQSSGFKAGEYFFPAHISAFEVASMLASGKTVVHHFTVPEGLMTSEILELIRNTPLLEGDITLDIKEGELLPETYNYSRGDKRNDLLTRMRNAMRKTLQEAWEGRADGMPLKTPEEALTLASIVEKETGLKAERPHVACVYTNRLKRGMLLQADPTTAYAITAGKKKLTRALSLADLQMDSPYNTYRSFGLPPGPIANPGRASIFATLHPLVCDDLYFVATGTGGHNFARTEAEHAENVRKYRAARR